MSAGDRQATVQPKAREEVLPEAGKEMSAGGGQETALPKSHSRRALRVAKVNAFAETYFA